jgi:hypothetical protein
MHPSGSSLFSDHQPTPTLFHSKEGDVALRRKLGLEMSKFSIFSNVTNLKEFHVIFSKKLNYTTKLLY